MTAGKLIVFSAPSGSGKTTLVNFMLSLGLNLEFSVSATSRTPRPNEINGKDYLFLSKEEFKRKIENDEFLEWEEVYKDCYYGTLKNEVERIRNKGCHVIFDVDVVGGINIKKFYGNHALAIFVKPPSLEELKNRLINRSTESKEKLKVRIEKATWELNFEDQFDVVIVNDDLNQAKDEVVKVVTEFLSDLKTV